MEKIKDIKIPQSPSEISTEWMKTMLPKDISNNIVSLRADEEFSHGGHLGKIEKLYINYSDRSQGPDSVIVKFQKCSDPKKEAEIYQLLEDAEVPYIPRLYGKFGDGNLVIEDLSSTHSVRDNFTIEESREVISLLADVNSRFWDNHRIPKDDLRHFINSININFEKGWDKFNNRYKEQLGKEVADFEWMWENREIVSRHYNSSPSTFSHGDVNRSNLLFPNDKNGKPIIIDWQLSGQKVLPFDISYFLVKGLTVEQRREHESTLIKEYYELLPDNIRSIYPFNNFMLDYRACVTRSMLSAVTKFGPIFENDFNYESSDVLSNRVIEAVKDYKPIEAIRELKNKKKF